MKIQKNPLVKEGLTGKNKRILCLCLDFIVHYHFTELPLQQTKKVGECI